jgi:hypothetical protein
VGFIIGGGRREERRKRGKMLVSDCVRGDRERADEELDVADYLAPQMQSSWR